ncbi:fibronectin type III domain-containing protein [Pseudoalteromonas aurantia]|uniref:Fibronectin type-III domain-containing protein n=1 Tax=Pseudoalteromonas aurantia 208 TaxID=1314867 RepID=A0ABR9EH77_9GAMM|nr:hypothetical protein [Pseudoalteromonas aurantia]MBE0370363.1 hypothetical protein [Pseudoalteromonas aurantia 208]
MIFYKRLACFIVLIYSSLSFASHPISPEWVHVVKNSNKPLQSVLIYWTTSKDSTHYAIEALTPSGKGWFNILDDSAQEYERLNVDLFISGGSFYGPQEVGVAKIVDMSGGRYSFRVKACNENGCSNYTGGLNYNSSRTSTVNMGDLYTVSPPTLRAIDNQTFEITLNSTTAGRFSDAHMNILANGKPIDEDSSLEVVSPFKISGKWGDYKWKATYKLKQGFNYARFIFKGQECINLRPCSTFSSDSKAVTLKRLNSPQPELLLNKINESVLRWNNVIYADYYIVEYSPSTDSNSDWHVLSPVQELEFNFNKYIAHAKRVRLKSCNQISNECSAYSSVLLVEEVTPPQNVKAVKSGNEILIDWDHVSGALHYEIEMKENEWSWVTATDSHYIAAENRGNKHLNKAVFGTQPSGKRQFRIAACSASVCSSFSAPSNRVEFMDELSPPQAPFVNNTPDGLFIDWEPVTAAEQYFIEIYLPNGHWVNYTKYLNFTSPLSIVGLQHKVGWVRFRVIACNQLVCSQPSPASNWLGQYIKPKVPTQPSGLAKSDRVTVRWEPVSHVDKYILKESMNGLEWVDISEQLQSSTSNSFSTTRPHGVYSYKVAACEQGNCSEFSVSSYPIQTYDQSSVSEPPNRVIVESTNKTVSVKWDLVKGASHYKLELMHENEFWQEVNIIEMPTGSNRLFASYTHKPHVSGNFQYRVSACIQLSSGEVCSRGFTYSEGINYTVPFDYSNPDSVTVEKYNDEIQVKWGVVQSATFYKVQLSYDGQPWLEVTDVLQPQLGNKVYVDFSHQPKMTGSYKYRVKACIGEINEMDCAGGYTESGALYYAVPVCSSTPKLSAAEEKNTISWCALQEKSIKYIEIEAAACDGDCKKNEARLVWKTIKSNIPVGNLFESQFGSITGLTVFRVRGCKIDGVCFGWSNTVSLDLFVDFPPDLQVQSTAMSWSEVPNATSYIIQIAKCKQPCHDFNNVTWEVIATDNKGVLSYAYNAKDNEIFRVKACFSANRCTSWSNPAFYIPRIKDVIFIHTNLLGSPMAETI